MLSKDNEYFFRIRGLVLPKKWVEDSFASDINRYIDHIQPLTEKLEDHLKNNRLPYFISNMDTVRSLLKSVYARWLETDAEAILRAVKYGRMEVCRKSLTPFITNLLTLSIEMQKAQSAEQSDEADNNEIEDHEDMANNLSAVGKLIDVGEYDRANSMLSDMGDSSTDEMIDRLIDLITSKKYDEACELASAMKERYIEYVKNPVGTGPDFSKKILAVDDRPELLAAISSVLQERYKVYCATSGKTALKMLRTQTPNLFILDIEMPEMNGYELAETLRASEEHNRTPIIFLTGNSTKERVMQAMKAGGNDFIVKPASQEALLAKVGKYFMI